MLVEFNCKGWRTGWLGAWVPYVGIRYRPLDADSCGDDKQNVTLAQVMAHVPQSLLR